MLTNLTLVKLFLNIATTDTTHDDLLKNLVNWYSRAIESFCNKAFEQTEYTETYDGLGSNVLFLDHYPISSVSSLEIDSVACEDSDYAIYSEGFIKLTDGSLFTKGDQNVTITYKAGYAQVPGDVQLCCTQLVAMKFKTINSDRIGIASQSFGDQNVGYAISEFPDDIKNILKTYQKVRI